MLIIEINLLMNDQKLFPLRLPPNYHGQPKPFRRLSEVYVEKTAQRQDNPQLGKTKISNWQLKRLDRDITQERREFLVHPAKISEDTPEWFKTTLHHFHRSNYAPRHRPDRAEEMRFTVLNQRRTNPFNNSGATADINNSWRIRREQPVAQKITMRNSTYRGRWASQREVTGKIGSVENRDYSVPHPQLKIGQTHPHNFIDTYQIA